MSGPVDGTRSEGGLGSLPFVDPHLAEGSGFRHWAEVPAPAPSPWPDPASRLPEDLGVEVTGAGTTMSLTALLGRTHGTALVVRTRDRVLLEWYADGVGPGSLLLGASMTKSVLACLVGAAVGAGSLGLDDPVVRHVPELAGSGYDGCTVRHVAAMTSGVAWQEDYRTPGSTAAALLGAFAAGAGGSRELLGQIPAEDPPGTRFRYCTPDSQVLDWVRERATGTGFADAVAALWRDLGCERGAAVGLDAAEPDGVPLAGGGLAACARDWARVGLLQLGGGPADGLPDGPTDGLEDGDWRDLSSRPATPFTRPGRLPSTMTTHAGFGLHWWPLDDEGRLVTADGSRGQFTFLDRDRGVVVVKTSRWPYDEATDRQNRDLCYLALPEIARAAVRHAEQEGPA